MDKLHRLAEIIETYDRFQADLRSRGISFIETEGGVWAPTWWNHIIPFLEYATEKKIMQPPGPIVDAGSGDCRVSAVLSVYDFNPVINIELDGNLVDVSKPVIDDLMQRSVIKGDIRTVHGDFTKSNAYDEAGVSFNDIPYFYHGINPSSLEKLAKKICNESPKGTKLVVYGLIYKGEEPDLPLKLMGGIDTKDKAANFLVYKK